MKDFPRRHGRGLRKGIAQKRLGMMETLESRDLLAGDCVVDPPPPIEPHGLVRDAAGEYFFHPVDAPAWIGDVTGPLDFIPDGGPKVPLSRLPLLHSNESAEQKIYLDFDGQLVGGTGWNESYDGQTISAPAFDLDGDNETFSQTELAMIEQIWTRVAEDFAPFELDVTTESPTARSFREGHQAIRVLVTSNVDERTGTKWFGDAGGVAYINSWRWESDTPVWVFANNLGGNEKRIAEAAAHELGHSFGLKHDGTSEEEYFDGFGSGHNGWAPIMGAGYLQPLTQWSRGEYDDANNSQNDLAIIASAANQVHIAHDDHGNDFTTASPLRNAPDQPVEALGLISSSSDKDVFSFEFGGGVINLRVEGVRLGSNLDIKATVLDQQGREIISFNPTSSLSSTVQTLLPSGQYYLQIDGVGNGDPETNGYSEYGSVGRYTIRGTIPNTVPFVPAVDLPTAPPAVNETPFQPQPILRTLHLARLAAHGELGMIRDDDRSEGFRTLMRMLQQQ